MSTAYSQNGVTGVRGRGGAETHPSREHANSTLLRDGGTKQTRTSVFNSGQEQTVTLLAVILRISQDNGTLWIEGKKVKCSTIQKTQDTKTCPHWHWHDGVYGGERDNKLKDHTTRCNNIPRPFGFCEDFYNISHGVKRQHGGNRQHTTVAWFRHLCRYEHSRDVCATVMHRESLFCCSR